MTEQTRPLEAPAADVDEDINEVVLQGRLPAAPVKRTLPSGDALWGFRIVVRRARSSRSRQRVDTIDCAVWGGTVRRSVASWRAGDVVEVRGAVRRRFFRAGAGAASRVEVEVTGGRLIRRGGSA